MVRTVLLCAALVLFGAIDSDAAQDPPPSSIAGVYRCSGFNPDGRMYSATVEIFKIENTYRVLWVLPNDTFVLGVGILTGDMLSVSYYGGSPAIVVYRVEGTQLSGQWTMGGQEGAVYAETLTLMPEHPPLEMPQAPPSRPQPVRAPDRVL